MISRREWLNWEYDPGGKPDGVQTHICTLREVVENLNIKPDGIYVDGTLGAAATRRGSARD